MSDSSQDTRALLHELRSGRLAPATHCQALITAIADKDPELRAFLPEPGRAERLDRAARALALRYPDPNQRPPLYGLPVAIKDIIRVDGLPTHAGSLLPAQLFAGPQATLVTQLEEAGALVLGKTACTEFAVMEPAATRNPRAPGCTPGGSSSGSAAAVAAFLAPVAIGSQTTGSMLRPAAYCGVVGFKPTYLRASGDGFIPIAHSLDHPGWFASNVEGVSALASVLLADWQPARCSQTLARPTIGVPMGPYLERTEEGPLAAFFASIARLANSGYRIERVPMFADFQEVWSRHDDLMSSEMAQVHAPWFDELRALYRSRTAAYIEKGRAVSKERQQECRSARSQLRLDISAVIVERGIDVFASPPALGPAPEGLHFTGDTSMNMPWTHAGMPAVCVPSGTHGGRPLGLQLAAQVGADEELLAWSTAIAAIVGD